MTATIATETTFARDARFVADALKIRYTPMVVARGEGPYLFDEEGKRYLDFGAGWALAALGYSDRRVRDAVAEQMARSTFAGSVSTINKPAVDLAEKLVSIVPGDFEKKAWFGLAGSDASEVAQRLILRATGKRRIVSFIGGWHGTTEASMGLSAHPSLTDVLSGGHVTKIPYPNPYRNPFGATGSELTDRCLSYLEDYLFPITCPPEQVAAIFVEAVQADSGDIVPPPDFLPKLRALCDRHGILLVVDEIKIGLGRTGRMFGYEHGGIAADLVILGKSLGGGLPLSAMVGRRGDPRRRRPASPSSPPSATAPAARPDWRRSTRSRRTGWSQRSAENGRYLQERLRAALNPFEIVGDVRGLGMILGVELVSDRESKSPNQRAAAKIVYRAWELGLIVFYAGIWGNVLEITPPLILTKEEIDQGVAILAQAIEDVSAGRVSDEAVAAFAGW